MAGTRKNSRTNKKNEVRVPFPMVLANVLVAVTVLGLSFMWLNARCDALGKEIKKTEQELDKAQKQSRTEQERWATLTNPSNLRAAIKRFNLNMAMPTDSQIVKLERRSDQTTVVTAMLGRDSLWME
jgi:cell division protein FtsB